MVPLAFLPAALGTRVYGSAAVGTGIVVELADRQAWAHLAWACQQHPDGSRRCINNDEGYVYLQRTGQPAPGASRERVYQSPCSRYQASVLATASRYGVHRYPSSFSAFAGV